jgi:hypothetical protein
MLKLHVVNTSTIIVVSVVINELVFILDSSVSNLVGSVFALVGSIFVLVGFFFATACFFVIRSIFIFQIVICCTFKILFLNFGMISSTFFVAAAANFFVFEEWMVILINMIFFFFSVSIPNFVLKLVKLILKRASPIWQPSTLSNPTISEPDSSPNRNINTRDKNCPKLFDVIYGRILVTCCD